MYNTIDKYRNTSQRNNIEHKKDLKWKNHDCALQKKNIHK